MASTQLRIDYPSKYPYPTYYDTLTISDNGSGDGTLKVKATLNNSKGTPWSQHYGVYLYISVDGNQVKRSADITALDYNSTISLEYEGAYSGTATVTAGWHGIGDNCSYTPVSGTISEDISAGYSTRTLTLSRGEGIESVSPSGTNTYKYGASVDISATVKSGYAWQSWSDGNTSQSRTIALTSNLSLTAQAYHTHPTITFDTTNACFRVDSDGSTTLSAQGEYAYIKFTVARGTADVTNVKIDGTQLGTSEGTYTYWVKQDKASAITYTVTVTDTVDSGASATIFVSTASVPLSLYDDGAGNVGLGVGLFASKDHINVKDGMILTGYSGTNSANKSIYDIANLSKVSQLTNDSGYINSSGSCASCTNADKVDGCHIRIGSVSVTTNQSTSRMGGGYYGQTTIDYSNTFSNTPAVMLQAYDNAAGFCFAEIDEDAGGISSSGCGITVFANSSTTTTVYWIAIGS